MTRHFRIAFLIILFLPSIATGKKKHTYTPSELIAISDSLLRSTIGDTMFQYCAWDSSSYYIWEKKDRRNFVAITEEEKINDRLTSATMRYTFTMPYSECAAYDTVSGIVEIVLQKQDSVFSLEAAPDMSFIPEIALFHEPCNFLSNEDALQKAAEAHLQKGITPAYAVLRYAPASKQFVWVVQSLLWEEKNFDHTHEPTKDVVIIDAVSGKILKHTTLLYPQEISNIF